MFRVNSSRFAPGVGRLSRLSFDKIGQHIACPQCHRTFVAGEASMRDNPRSVERPDGSSSRSESRVDRIEAICPGCQAMLRVRRNYIGNDVICKGCKQVFQVQAPAETQATPELDQPDARQQELEAEHEQLNVTHKLLLADHDRLERKRRVPRKPAVRHGRARIDSCRAGYGPR